MKINLHNCDVYVGWELNYIGVKNIEDLRTLCKELKSKGLVFWVRGRGGVLGYTIFPRRTIVSFSNKETMTIQ